MLPPFSGHKRAREDRRDSQENDVERRRASKRTRVEDEHDESDNELTELEDPSQSEDDDGETFEFLKKQ